MPSDRHSPVDLRDGLIYPVLELHFGGTVRYFSIDALDIVRTDGSVIQAEAAMMNEARWTEAIKLGSTDVPLRSVSLELATKSIDWAEEYSLGRDLGMAYGELSQWVSGTTWEKRRQLVSGLVHKPMYGALGEGCSFTLKSHPFEDRTMIPDGDAVVDSTTWPDASQEALGESYPEVFGQPGAGPGGTRFAGTRGLIVDKGTSNRYLLIAGHRVQATHVEVINAKALPSGTWDTLAVTHTTDGRGRTIARVQLPSGSSGSDAKFDEDSTYVVSWGYDGQGGGRYNSTETDVMRDAGEVLRYLFNRSNLRLDRGRTTATLDLLRGRRLDFAVLEPINAWELIRTRILPALPVSIRNGPDGLYPVAWRQAVDGPVEYSYDVQRGDLVREGRIRTRSTLHGSLANEFRIAYAIDVTRKSNAQFLLTGDPRIASDADTATNLACRISRARAVQTRPELQNSSADRIELDAVWDSATASAAAFDQAIMRALPAREITYIDSRERTQIEEGAAVEITDSDLSLSAARAIVSQIETRADESRALTLLLIDPAAL